MSFPKNSDYIHFYGSDQHETFLIERKAMDRPGFVLTFLDENLPSGLVLDVGAGNGYTASRLNQQRQVLCLEPSTKMIDRTIENIWLKGTAESIPLHDNYLDGAYSTWAYFLSGVDKTAGLAEVERVVKTGGKIIIIDNQGDDEFCKFATHPIVTEEEFYLKNGFTHQVLESAFIFENLRDAQTLMELFFGKEKMAGHIRLQYQYKIAVYTKTVK